MEEMMLCAPCLFGLESVLSAEVRQIGGDNIQTTDGRVMFTGDAALLARANIFLRTAERVCVVLGTFVAKSFTELFDNTVKIAFEDYIGKKDAFPVKGWSLKSLLHSVPDCQSIIKKAVVKRLEKAYGLSWFEEQGPTHQIQFTIHKDTVTIMLDSTGIGLHKRGYRTESTLAPIKETLAAGIVDLAHIRPDDLVVDPMCGSGTLLIESALRAFHIAPGIRRHFSAEKWGLFPIQVWKDERSRAMESIRRGIGFSAQGFDIDELAIRLTAENAARAGVGRKITVHQQALSDFTSTADRAVVLCNPPYGERLLERKEAEKLYREMGRKFERKPGWHYYIISPHEQFEELFGRMADKRRKLYNGMIRCQLYMYFQ